MEHARLLREEHSDSGGEADAGHGAAERVGGASGDRWDRRASRNWADAGRGIYISRCSITCVRVGVLAYPVPEGAPLPVGKGTTPVEAMGRALLEPAMGMTLLDSTGTAPLEPAIGMTLELPAGPLGAGPPPTVTVE